MALDCLDEFKSKIKPEIANKLKLVSGDGLFRTAKQTALLNELMAYKVRMKITFIPTNS